MSDCRQQTWIEAPVEVVWDLIADVNRHPEWWPRVVDVQCDGLEPACEYKEVVQTPFGKDEMRMKADRVEDLRELKIRCVNSGTYFHLLLTAAQDGTFVDGRFGMDPADLGHRVFDVVAGKRYFRRWLANSLEAMREAARARAASQRAI